MNARHVFSPRHTSRVKLCSLSVRKGVAILCAVNVEAGAATAAAANAAASAAAAAAASAESSEESSTDEPENTDGEAESDDTSELSVKGKQRQSGGDDKEAVKAGPAAAAVTPITAANKK